MKKSVLFIMALVLCVSINAKEWKVDTGGMRVITFELPDSYECVYGGDSVKNDIRYRFKKDDGTLLTVMMIEIENMDESKVKQMPDTMLMPGLKGLEIIERHEPIDGEISRIITIKDYDGSILRDYLCFSSNGIFLMSAYSPTGDFTETDNLAQTINSHFQWKLLLVILLALFLVFVPAFFFGNAWEHRKHNRARFWRCVFGVVLFALVISAIGAVWLDFTFWKLLLAYLVSVFFIGYMIGSGVTIISF